MSKYIDADKLKAEIERQIQNLRGIAVDNPMLAQTMRLSFEGLLSFIASLQQEQPEQTCKSCGFYENNCPFIRGKLIPYPNKVCKDYTYSAMKEQPEVDLEKELNQWRHGHFNGKRDGDYSGEYLERESQLDIARHFYELGLNARKKE